MSKLVSSFLISMSVFVLSSCGQNKSEGSKLNGNAPAGSDCQGQVPRKIDGKNTYYRYSSGTTGEQSTASRGKIIGCWYPTTEEAKQDVKATCNKGGTANCDAEGSWQLETAQFTFGPSVMQPKEEAPIGGGCYQKLPSNYNTVCRGNGKSDCDRLYWAGCGWAEPRDSDGDGISDVSDSCPSQRETVNGYKDSDGCPDTPEPENVPGVYKEASGRISYVASSKHYCVYTDMVAFKNVFKSPSYIEIQSLPQSLTYDGDCNLPEGVYRLPSQDIFYVAPSAHFCRYPNMESYVAHGSPGYIEILNMPNRMVNDGDCQ